MGALQRAVVAQLADLSGKLLIICRNCAAVSKTSQILLDNETQAHRVAAWIAPHRLLDVHIASKLFFELRKLRTEHITATFQHVKNGLINLRFQLVVLLYMAIEPDF